jgi:hypothetical protein
MMTSWDRKAKKKQGHSNSNSNSNSIQHSSFNQTTPLEHPDRLNERKNKTATTTTKHHGLLC